VINTQNTSKIDIAKLNLVTNPLIEQRISEFQELHKKDNKAWFSELCFCLLTANSKAATAIQIQNEIGPGGFLNFSENEIRNTIKKFGHRFHNNKTKYIVEARKHASIKDLLGVAPNIADKRIFLVKSIKGLGLKEASHFLRNVGYSEVAIIDRHILRWMKENNFISKIPKTITPKFYIECEDILSGFGIPLDKLDLIIWQKVTGKVLK